MCERAKIAGAVILFQPSEGEAGNGVVEVDLQEQETFVVAEADVVARVKLLDEAAFKQERFGLAFDQVDVEIVNRVDQCIELQIPSLAARRVKILRHALPEVTR